MSTHAPKTSHPAKPAPSVPRDAKTDTAESSRRNRMPSPDEANPLDEDFTAQDKPLMEGSREARALHDRPPRGKGQLGVGTAGDAARPSKEGLHNKPVPPRGEL